METSKKALFLTSFFFLAFFLSGIGLLIHAWHASRVVQITEEIQESLSKSEIISLIDLQIEHARNRLAQLEPGPPPPWFYPSYYYDWLPKARLYAEAQEVLQALRKQKMEMIEQGKTQLKRVKTIWNVGVSPILHTLLAFTLIFTSLRCVLRFALWRGLFPWMVLEK